MKAIIDVFHKSFSYHWRSHQAMHDNTILHLVIPQICTTLQEIAWPSYPRMQSMLQLDFNANSMELNFKSLQSAQHSRQSHLKAPSVYCVDLLIGRNLSYAQVKMLPVQSLFNPLTLMHHQKRISIFSRAQTRLSDRSKFESLSQPGFRL